MKNVNGDNFVLKYIPHKNKENFEIDTISEKDENSITRIGLKKRTSKLLIRLINDNLFNIKKKEYMSNTEKLLIEEIKKPKLNLKLKKKLTTDPNSRKIEKIQILIKLIPGFTKFMKYYNIDDEAVRIAAGLITYRRYASGSYVFKQGDKSDSFYGIISGKIIIKENKKILQQEDNNFRTKSNDPQISFSKERFRKEYIEENKLTLKEGQCFGEWGLIYNSERSASAFCIEDVDLFVIDSHGFEQSFNKCMTKAEMDRKLFLIKYIPFFASLPRHRFDNLYKSFISHFLSKKDMIYFEGDKADSIYLIYQGSCSLEKNIMKPNKKNEIKNITIMHLQCGNIAGIESLNRNSDKYKNTKDNTKNEPDKRAKNTEGNIELFPVYKSSLISEDDNTIIIQIRMSSLNELRLQFCNAMQKLKNIKDKTLDEFIQKRLDNLSQDKLTYRTDLMKSSLNCNSVNNYSDKELLNKVETMIKNSRNLTPKNNFKNFKMKVKRNPENFEQETLLRKCKKGKSIEESVKNVLKNSFYQKIDKNINIDNFHSNFSSKRNTVVSTKQNNFNKSNTRMFRKFPSFIRQFSNLKTEASTGVNIHDEKDRELLISNNINTDVSTPINNISNDATKSFFACLSTVNNPILIEDKDNIVGDKMDKKVIRKRSFTNQLPKDLKKFSHLQTYQNLKLNSNNRKKNKNMFIKLQANERIILPRQVKRSISNWNSTLNKKMFDSGSYDLPMMCFTNE